jgi:acyl-homoserine lactone acylase PvdQ
MLKQGKGWIVNAVLMVVTTLPVCVFAQDTTVRDTESDGRQRSSRNNGRVVRDSDGIPHIAASTEREVIYLQGFTHAQDRLFQRLPAAVIELAGNSCRWRAAHVGSGYPAWRSERRPR